MSESSYVPYLSVFGPTSLVSELDLVGAAEYVTGGSLTDLPRLVSDMALENASIDLAKQSGRELKAGLVPSFEYVPMPKHGYGNRPLAVLSPQTRVVLEALVSFLEDSLLASSRARGFQEFESFGTETAENWLVDFDIAACYEFIDHNVLSDELILQGADPEAVETLRLILNSLLGRQIGLPQGVNSSHRLADSYLDQIDRNLARRGYELKRYADDYRVITDGREQAYHVIEAAMDEARRVHLALAEQKIYVKKADKLAEEIQERSSKLGDYAQQVYGDLSEEVFVQVDYDEVEIEYAEPDPEEVDFAAIKQLLADWADQDKSRSRVISYAGTVALSSAKSFSERLPNDSLEGIILKEPVRLRKVMEYMLSRHDESANWSLLNALSLQERSTPWQKIWILSTASKLVGGESVDKEEFANFASTLLEDSHETVRLEAAWFLSLIDHPTMNSAQLQRLYTDASRTTRIGLAAVAGRLSCSQSGSEMNAIRGEGILNQRAFEWGKAFG